MSANVPSGDNDIIEGNSQGFVVAVPNSANTEFVSYLRLGQASATDESYLQEDPAATGSNPPLISKAGTTSPFSDGGLAYTTGTMQFVAPYSYIRLGTPTAYETWLPQSTTSADGTVQPSNGGGFPTKGVLIYSNDTVQTFAPSIGQTTDEFSHWSGDNLTVVKSGSAVVSANRTLGSAGTSASFQIAAQMNTTLGTVTNAITGQNITQWLGNDASTGLGSLLWSNYGSTQNVFGGQVINLINSGIDVQGLFESKIASDITTIATSSIILAANPVGMFAQIGATAVSNRAAMITGIIATAVEVAMDAISDVEVPVTGAISGESSTAMRASMDVAYGAIATASVAVLVVQAMAIIAGNIAVASAKTAGMTPMAGIKLTNAGVLIQSGGTQFFVSAAGVETSAPTFGVTAEIAAFTL